MVRRCALMASPISVAWTLRTRQVMLDCVDFAT
jgi:hypothetical protein